MLDNVCFFLWITLIFRTIVSMRVSVCLVYLYNKGSSDQDLNMSVIFGYAD